MWKPFLQNSPFQIIQGGKAVITVSLINPATQGPYDLTLLSAATTCFMNADGSELALSLTSGIAVNGAPNLGQLQITLTSEQTDLLQVVDLTTLEIALVLSNDPSNKIKVQIPNAYSVLPTIC